MTDYATETSALSEFILAHPKLTLISGAGISTESGIGDYRGPDGQWKHSPPVQYKDFMQDRAWRQRYWSRSMLGWPSFAAANPNAGHRACAELERQGRVQGLITQNVDRLHQRAGQQHVLDLHGRLDIVACQSCDYQLPRAQVQATLMTHNADLLPDLRTHSEQLALSKPNSPMPDGDAVVTDPGEQFQEPSCVQCGGILKPDVVFYGESVPAERVALGYKWVADADAVLVVGSSLMVFSSFRFVRAAAEANTPIAILNLGVTRADELATLKLNAPCGSTLTAALEQLKQAS